MYKKENGINMTGHFVKYLINISKLNNTNPN